MRPHQRLLEHRKGVAFRRHRALVEPNVRIVEWIDVARGHEQDADEIDGEDGEQLHVEVGEDGALLRNLVSRSSQNMDLDPRLLPLPDLADTESPINLELVDPAAGPLDLDRQLGREAEALALAERASDVFCSWGVRTHAHLLERVGHVEQAEEWYRRDAGRYEYDARVAPPLFGFYYRRARVAGDAAYEDRFASALAKMFPNGLEPLPEEADAAAPTDGVLVDGESKRLEWAGLRGGDVIVGLDGWRVHSLDQYDSIVSFRDATGGATEMKIRVWRQTLYIDLEANVRARYFSVRMRTYGTPGPSYLWR